jgi:hypothetical protein
MCSKVLVHRFLRLFNCSSVVFQGFDALVLRYSSLSFVHNLEHNRCREWSRQDPQFLGKVKWSWFSVHVPDELTSFENKQKTATRRLTKYRNQGWWQSDYLALSQTKKSCSYKIG